MASLAADTEAESSRTLMELLSSGTWVPFLTHHLLEEISFHADEGVFDRRWSLLGRFPHVGFMNLPEATEMIGSVFDLRTLEIAYLDSHPEATHTEVIEATKPSIITGFSTGSAFVCERREFWRSYKQHLSSGRRRRVAEIANIRHFSSTDQHELIPEPAQQMVFRSRKDAAEMFKALAIKLQSAIVQFGDVRNFDPEEAAERFMRENWEALPAQATGPFGIFLKQFNVQRERLPEKATWGDLGDEGIFIQQLALYSEAALRNFEELMSRVRKEAVPSWVIWSGLDKIIRAMPLAETGNVIDLHTAQFGLYVDLLNADKRIAHALQQGARRNALMQQVSKRVPVKRGIAGLIKGKRQPEPHCREA